MGLFWDISSNVTSTTTTQKPQKAAVGIAILGARDKGVCLCYRFFFQPSSSSFYSSLQPSTTLSWYLVELVSAVYFTVLKGVRIEV